MIQLQPSSVYIDQHDAIAYVNELADIANYFNDESNDCTIALKEYKKNLINICDAVTDVNIVDLFLILVEGIDKIIEREVDLTNDHCRFLSRLPILINDCLSYSESKMPATVLIRHMASSAWSRPLSKDEESYFLNRVVTGGNSTQSLEVDESKEVVDLSNYTGTGELDDGDQKSSVDESVSLSNSLTEIDLTDLIEDDEPNNEFVTSEEVFSAELDQGLDELDISSFLPSDKKEEEILEVVDEALEEDSDSLNCNTELLSDHISENVLEPEAEVADSLVDNKSSRSDDFKTEVSDSGESVLDARQQELVDLICAELEDVIETNDSYLNTDLQDVEAILNEAIDHSENIGNAIDLLGLVGLSNYCKLISTNVNHLLTEKQRLQKSDIQNLLNWPKAVLNYLKNIFNTANRAPLIEYITSNGTLFDVNGNEINELVQLISNPSLVEEEVPQRQQQATLDDVDISLPEDVNQELLDGLLQDLPSQTEEFSSSIQNIADLGDVHYLEVAQRIAHTLKGAANVVGVKGVANLTHHLEDILELQYKARKIPIPPLMEVLLSASDCLEAMTEALLGIDEPPDDAVQVLQNVLDWANKLDVDGVSNEAVPASNPKNIKEVRVKEESSQLVSEKKYAHDSGSSENMLRVPASLADELLRLAGESLITTGQIQDRIKNTIKHYSHLKTHNQSLQQLSFDLEHLIDIQGITTNLNLASIENGTDFDPLEMDEFHELHSVSRRLIELSADSFELSKVMEHEITELNDLVIAQDNIQKESQQHVLRTRMVPVKTIVPRLKRGIRQASRVTGKQVELIVADNDTYLDSEVLNELIEPMMHLLRNAVDHGIESLEERKAAGKSGSGLIELEFSRMGDLVIINIKDDGRGIDDKAILAKAIKKGFVRKEQVLSHDEILRVILEQGFSTREEVTQVSGRGIGLDVVNVKIRDLKGMINIYSDIGRGSRFELILPMSSFSTHSLLIRVRQNIYAISSRGVEEILYPSLGKLTDIGHEMIFQVDDQAYGAINLDQLLNLPEDPRALDRNARPVLIVKEEAGSKRAVLVQEVLDSRDVVVKPLGKYLPKMHGIVGATILGDGSVSPVIDLPELLQKSKSGMNGGSATEKEPTRSNHKRLPYVLVVDDSLSARRSLTQFIQDMGMNVRSARDGMEAVSLIEARKPDIVLIDMEMPRMNGLELTSHIRGTHNTSSIPIVMITSRSSEKHKKAAMDRGVNYFMVKPFSEDELAKFLNSTLDIT